jgi:hypothetical protein
VYVAQVLFKNQGRKLWFRMSHKGSLIITTSTGYAACGNLSERLLGTVPL